MLLFYRTCDNCGSSAEARVFEDSWTGMAFCLICLTEEPETGQANPLRRVTMSPDENDNLAEIFPGIKEEVAS